MKTKRYLMEMICGFGLVLIIFWHMAEGMLQAAVSDETETLAESLQEKLEFYSEIRHLDTLEEFEERQCGELGSEVFFGVSTEGHLTTPLPVSIRVDDVKVLPLEEEEAWEYLRQSTFDGDLCKYAGSVGDFARESVCHAVVVVQLEMHNYSGEAIQYGQGFGHFILDENYSMGNIYESGKFVTTVNNHFFYHSAEPRLDYARAVREDNKVVFYRESDYRYVNTDSFYLEPGKVKMTILFLVSEDELEQGLYLSNYQGVLGMGEDKRYHYCNVGYCIKIL